MGPRQAAHGHPPRRSRGRAGTRPASAPASSAATSSRSARSSAPSTRHSPPPSLLIDELDRADEPFEAFLLELLADFQITIPELGTIRAETPPVILLTSNRTREVHDAIRRRCLYQWVDYPTPERERAILAAKAPGVPARLSAEVVAFVQRLRTLDLFKLPGVAETIDWAASLQYLDQTELGPNAVDQTLGVLLKYQDDIARIRGAEAARLISEAQEAA